MQDEIDFRIAGSEHLDGIVDVWIEFIDFHADLDEFYTRRKDGNRNFRSYLETLLQDKNAAIWVALNGKQVIGYLLAKIESVPPVFITRAQGQIWDLAVKEGFRFSGIGETLLKKCIDWFKERDIGTIILRVLANNETGLRFWRKHGFVERVYEMRRNLA